MRDQPLVVETRKKVQATQLRELPIVRRVLIAGLLTTLWLVPLLTVNAWVGAKVSRQHAAAHATVPAQTSGPSWATSTARTAASFFFTLPSATESYVDPAFQAYYTAHLGASQLGQPITAAIPIHQGLVQFFVAGALLLPAAHTASSSAGDFSQQLINDGVRDDASGVVRLPLLHALLTAGSTLPLGGDDSGLTYVNLRTASRAEALLPDPDVANAATTMRAEANQPVFVTEGQRAGHAVGHTIPLVIWSYLQRQDVLPDGWQTDLGLPLSEALPATVVRADGVHRLLVQAFGREVLIADLDTIDSTGAPAITRQSTGTDYLRTLGVPPIALSAGNQLWTLGDVAVVASPASASELIHIGENFSLTSAGGARWAAGALWYHVRWSVPHSTGDGWIAATATSVTPPGAEAVAWASFDVLSPQLATFLASQGENVAAVVYDLTRSQYYGYQPDSQFIMASSAKVPIMLALLTMTEDQQREPNDNEMYLLTTMIENSDNDSAQALIEEIGGAPALASLMQRVGVPGMVPNGDAWGWSTISPYAMARLLALLHDGKILTAQDRGIALGLMQNIEPDQRTGAGDTAPPGATVAMKDGWVPAPDGLWAMNTSGIVTVGNETYVVTVFTQHENSLDDGWAITRRVCGDVAKLLA